MGKGDKKTRRGKITQGSYGKTRPKKYGKPAAVLAEKSVKPSAEKAEPKPKTAKPKAEKPAETEEKPKAKKSTKKTEE